MEHKKTKITIVSVFLLAFILWITTPVFAYETTEFDPTVISYDTGTPYSFSIFNDTNALGSFGTSRKGIGFEFSNPIPYYSDGDHYSIFLHFIYLMPSYVMQYGYSECYIYPFTNSPNMSFLETGTQLFMVGQPTSYNNSYKGQKTFRTYGDASCSVKYQYFVAYIDTATIAVSVNMVLDLNLVPEMELFPFRLGMQMSYSGSTTYDHQIMNNFRFYYTDTSLYGLLEGIESAVEQIDFSGLSGLSTLSTTVENFYQTYITNSNTQIGLLESMIDDTEEDEDLTRWAEQQSEVGSMADYLHEMESSYFDALSDFTFPEQPNQTAVGNVFNMFFDNSYILTLIVLALSIMMVCCLLW